MKFICTRTSGYREEKPCDEALPEVVITYDCRTLPKEQMAKVHKDERFLKYENFTFSDGRAGCRRKIEEDAYTLYTAQESIEEAINTIEELEV